MTGEYCFFWKRNNLAWIYFSYECFIPGLNRLMLLRAENAYSGLNLTNYSDMS